MPYRTLNDRITELERKVGNMLFYAIVLEVKDNKVRAAQGDLITGWIPVFQPAAGNDEAAFIPIKKGEEVCVLCPNGSIEAGAAIRGLNYSKQPIQGDGKNETVFRFENGSSIKYSKSDHKIQITVTGNAEIEANKVVIKPADTCQVAQSGIGTFGVLTDLSKCPVFGITPAPSSQVLKTDC